MKFKVSGASKDTGARMTMEIEADSKGAAEKKAAAQGMVVNHAVPMGDGAGSSGSRAGRSSGGSGGGMGTLVKLLVVVAILAAAAYFAWPYVRGAQ